MDLKNYRRGSGGAEKILRGDGKDCKSFSPQAIYFYACVWPP